MVVDASAIVAILVEEPEAADLSRRLDEAGAGYTHPVSIYEATTAFARLTGQPVVEAYRIISTFITSAELHLISIGEAETITALEAFARYGKGQKHPAQLNMSDCFSYACAKLRGMPLLYKGEDFAQTDLA